MRDAMARAAAPLPEVIRHVRPEQLGAPTPCADWAVRDLVNHLLYWAPSLVGAARKETVPPQAVDEPPAALEEHVARLVAAWSRPDAWEGTTHMGGPTPLPATTVGAMVAGELVVHGWDLARATGQHPEWDKEILDYLLEETTRFAAQGREMGVYGAEVPVPRTASTLDRVLALTGRDPGWGG